jgi:hypothetical protein
MIQSVLIKKLPDSLIQTPDRFPNFKLFFGLHYSPGRMHQIELADEQKKNDLEAKETGIAKREENAVMKKYKAIKLKQTINLQLLRQEPLVSILENAGGWIDSAFTANRPLLDKKILGLVLKIKVLKVPVLM